MRAERRGFNGIEGRVLWLEQATGPSAAARTDFGSWRLGNCTVGKLPLVKILLGSCSLGKYLTSSRRFFADFHPWNPPPPFWWYQLLRPWGIGLVFCLYLCISVYILYMGLIWMIVRSRFESNHSAGSLAKEIFKLLLFRALSVWLFCWFWF